MLILVIKDKYPVKIQKIEKNYNFCFTATRKKKLL